MRRDVLVDPISSLCLWSGGGVSQAEGRIKEQEVRRSDGRGKEDEMNR